MYVIIKDYIRQYKVLLPTNHMQNNFAKKNQIIEENMSGGNTVLSIQFLHLGNFSVK